MQLTTIHCISPTRRSSDLGRFRTRASARIENITPRRRSIVVTELPYLVGPEKVIEKIKEAVQSKRRSEEHTSELQSRGQLVCRLLLEKEKNGISYISLYSH